MSETRGKKTRTAIPQYIKRAVIARDGNTCKNCGVETEFLHWDHLVPFDLGGPNTVENIQRLCPTCNTSKGNRIQCHRCRHLMSPDKSSCAQCEAPLIQSKYSKTFKGRAERSLQKVGLITIIGGAAGLVLLVVIGVSVFVYLISRSGNADQARNVSTIVNDSFSAPFDRPASFKITIPSGAKNSRVVGGFKVTSGPAVNFFIVSDSQYQLWSNGAGNASLLQRRQATAKIRQPLGPGSYYILFAAPDPGTSVTVAAELYSKYD
jgi:hypothetical protein